MTTTGRWKYVLTPEQIHRVLGLPEGAELAEVDLTQDPPGIHIVWEGPGLPDGWTLPNGAGECPPWRPASGVVPTMPGGAAAEVPGAGDIPVRGRGLLRIGHLVAPVAGLGLRRGRVVISAFLDGPTSVAAGVPVEVFGVDESLVAAGVLPTDVQVDAGDGVFVECMLQEGRKLTEITVW